MMEEEGGELLVLNNKMAGNGKITVASPSYYRMFVPGS
jgi:hypothetical protein